jgi:hypothetical protein
METDQATEAEMAKALIDAGARRRSRTPRLPPWKNIGAYQRRLADAASTRQARREPLPTTRVAATGTILPLLLASKAGQRRKRWKPSSADPGVAAVDLIHGDCWGGRSRRLRPPELEKTKPRTQTVQDLIQKILNPTPNYRHIAKN